MNSFVNSLLYLLVVFKVAFTDVQRFDELYTDGIEAYWNENWEGCIFYLEKALESYKFMQEGVKNCSKKCSEEVNAVGYTYAPEYIINKASCLELCKKEKFGSSRLFSRVSKEMLDIFKHKRTYVYLQFAYFRAGEFSKSLAATHTYAMYDPDDHMMQENMKYYLNHENTTEEMFVNLELLPHQLAYDLAIEAYNREDYEEAVKQFEDALIQFYDADEGCRGLCEGEYDGGDEYPEKPVSFHRQIVDHYRSVLECYMTCPAEMARVSVKTTINNFLPKHYHYLQYAYYHLNEHKKAAECAKAYLLFFPDNKMMKGNLKHFQNIDNVEARKDASKFYERINAQVKLLAYIYQNFGIRDYNKALLNVYPNDENDDEDDQPSDAADTSIDDTDEDINVHEEVTPSEKEIIPDKPSSDNGVAYSSMNEKTEDIIASKDSNNERLEKLRKKRMADANQLKEDDVDISHLKDAPVGYATVDSKFIVTIANSKSLYEKPVAEGPMMFNMVLLANSTQMVGPTRFAVDQLANQEQCQDLIDLELSGGISGDGYKGRSSPHTSHELFQGITVHRAAQLAEEGQLPLRPAKLYYELSERARLQVKAYFHIEEELYFDYTHLVCRTALKASDDSFHGVSHPIHGDNCVLRDDGRCIKEDPAYTWRDYSSIMYLNDDFDGGEFIMTDDTSRRVMVEVKPTCGRLVSFSAGKECLHGVKPITRGRRCAMALWFTLDRSHDEQLRIEAKQILDRLTTKDEL